MEYKRPVALVLLAATLVLAVTGLWIWSGVLGAGRGGGIYSLRHTLRDVHLYAGWVFIGAASAHVALNWRPMLRHLGFAPRSPASPGMLHRR
ncbi:exported hypothetical protein [uncultured Alphaproteobacteria bacterium]|uniref:Flavinylation-associated cytochrome domain-containing protein n=1 Tax=uncultured Alphaproteobacteria bacterium TaxID=91750 RepID=A0A212JHG0_9PROT|nr:exported hypothetical protein [uncultured Alphaproteobacteria bacterium]